MLGFLQLDAISLPRRLLLYAAVIGSFLQKVDVSLLHKRLHLFGLLCVITAQQA
jgi:hypothetical protein